MKKGFATSAILYTLLLLFLVLMVNILNNLQNKKVILDALKQDTINALQSDVILDTLLEQIGVINNKVLALENQIQEQKELIASLQNVNGTVSLSVTFGAIQGGQYSISSFVALGNLTNKKVTITRAYIEGYSILTDEEVALLNAGIYTTAYGFNIHIHEYNHAAKIALAKKLSGFTVEMIITIEDKV